MTKARRETLRRMAAGWVPMRPQLTDWKWYDRHGFVRLSWGPEGTDTADKMVWYITDKGRAEVSNVGP